MKVIDINRINEHDSENAESISINDVYEYLYIKEGKYFKQKTCGDPEKFIVIYKEFEKYLNEIKTRLGYFAKIKNFLYMIPVLIATFLITLLTIFICYKISTSVIICRILVVAELILSASFMYAFEKLVTVENLQYYTKDEEIIKKCKEYQKKLNKLKKYEILYNRILEKKQEINRLKEEKKDVLKKQEIDKNKYNIPIQENEEKQNEKNRDEEIASLYKELSLDQKLTLFHEGCQSISIRNSLFNVPMSIINDEEKQQILRKLARKDEYVKKMYIRKLKVCHQIAKPSYDPYVLGKERRKQYELSKERRKQYELSKEKIEQYRELYREYSEGYKFRLLHDSFSPTKLIFGPRTSSFNEEEAEKKRILEHLALNDFILIDHYIEIIEKGGYPVSFAGNLMFSKGVVTQILGGDSSFTLCKNAKKVYLANLIKSDTIDNTSFQNNSVRKR